MNIMSRLSPLGAQDPVRRLVYRLFDGGLFTGGLQNDDRDASSVVTSQWMPPVDIREEHDRFVLYADVPGVDPQDIEVQMDRGMLTIRGERRTENGDRKSTRLNSSH